MKTLSRALVAAFATLVVWLVPPPAFSQPVNPAPSVASGLRVDGFDVEQVARLAPGTPLLFSLYGTPGGTATLQIAGATQPLAMQEVQSGVYEGRYVIGDHDRIAPDSRVTATLWQAGQATTVQLEEPLVLGAVLAEAPRACGDCAVVESVRAVRIGERPGVVGAMAGGLIGAILGNQFGRGDGRTAARILGAVGGAYVGHEIERRQAEQTRYDVVVRRADGTTQTRRYDTAPPFKAGDRVRVLENGLQPEAPAP